MTRARNVPAGPTVAALSERHDDWLGAAVWSSDALAGIGRRRGPADGHGLAELHAARADL